MPAIDDDFIKATAGWMQCADILESVTESFDFAMSELLRQSSGEWSEEKKVSWLKADSRLRLAIHRSAEQGASVTTP